MSAPFFIGRASPDVTSTMLGTGYSKFYREATGVGGLAKWTEKRLDVLALHSDEEGCGHIRQFIADAKSHFETVCVWEVWNQFLKEALVRYGFTPETEIQPWGEPVEGLRWDKIQKQ